MTPPMVGAPSDVGSGARADKAGPRRPVVGAAAWGDAWAGGAEPGPMVGAAEWAIWLPE
ncbi:hypothetical protein ACFVZW_05235 [Streptomyces sp. NPDC059567]|uniref:hypothetical protein n=1 Tax=Streptomyces sp. NPDC059567 TaxID=3346867 RepID=UPI0036CEDA37